MTERTKGILHRQLRMELLKAIEISNQATSLRELFLAYIETETIANPFSETNLFPNHAPITVESGVPLSAATTKRKYKRKPQRSAEYRAEASRRMKTHWERQRSLGLDSKHLLPIQ